MISILEEGFVVSFHRRRTRYRRSEEVRIKGGVSLKGPVRFKGDIRKYPGNFELPPETIDQEIDSIDRIRVYTRGNPQLHYPVGSDAIRIFNEMFNEMFMDRIYVSDDAFLKLCR